MHLLQLKHKVQDVMWDLDNLLEVIVLFKGPISNPVGDGSRNLERVEIKAADADSEA